MLRLIPLLALGACVSAAPLDMDRPTGEWQLEHLNGAPQDAPKPTMTFDGEQVSGFAGCNRFFARVEQNPDVASYFGGVGSTRMACAGSAMQMEASFLGALGATRDVRVVEGKLRFFDAADAEIMRFTPAAAQR